MRHYTILRLLLAAFFLYIAWPMIPNASSNLELMFWGSWLLFFFFVVGSNFATLLHISRPPVMEQEELRARQYD